MFCGVVKSAKTVTNMEMQEPGPRPFLPPCRVCGDQAAGFHYGVNTCEACKGFFHRSLIRYQEYQCRANRTSGYCQYKPGKRKSCQFCRYQKCLRAGMSKAAIKTGRYTYLKKTEDNRELHLLSLESRLTSDSRSLEAASVASRFDNPTSLVSELAELPDKRYHENSVLVDYAANQRLDALSVSENKQREPGDDLSSYGPLWSGDSLTSEIRGKHSTSVKCAGRYGNRADVKKIVLFPSQDGIKPRIHGHVIHTKHSSLSSMIDPTQNPYLETNRRQDSELICCTEFRPSQNKHISNSTSHKLSARSGHHNKLSNSVVYRVLKNPGHIKSLDRIQFHESSEHTHFSKGPIRISDGTPNSLSTSCEETSLVSLTDSIDTPSGNLTINLESGNTHLADSTFDLFPDISFCLSGQAASPFIPIRNDESTSLDEQLDPCSSLWSQSPASTSDCPAPSPWGTVLNLNNRKGLSYDNPETIDTELCVIAKSFDPAETPKLTQMVALQIMDEYTQSLDLIVESPTAPVPITWTMSNPSYLTSVTSMVSRDSDTPYQHTVSSAQRRICEVKNPQTSDFPELYRDKDAVISVLLASHKENIEDYLYMPKEEMLAQQKAHYDECQLKRQTFGDLGFLDEKEYDDIYSITGIDVDNRRQTIHKYLSWMERQVRGQVQFAKSIPGFSYLDINIQMELIKLARPEFAILTVYPTVNLELGITLGLTGEQWACDYELGTVDVKLAISEYMTFCDKLQKMAPTQEEEVLLKAILVVSTDRDSSVNSPLAEVIRWQLFMCLFHSLEKNREQPSIFLARYYYADRYILALTQSRTVAEGVKDFLRQMKLRKYSTIEQNPLLWEMYSWILKTDDDREQQG